MKKTRKRAQARRTAKIEKNITVTPEIQKIRDQLVLDNVKYVYKFAASPRYNGLLPYDDLIQEGLRGLIIASQKFDPKKKVPFIGFARIYIKKYIILGITSQLKPARNCNYGLISLNAPIRSDDGTGNATIESFIPDPRDVRKDIFPAEAQHVLVRYMDQYLKDLEKKVIIHRYGIDGQIPLTLDAISKKIDYTIPGVRMIEIRALRKLKEAMAEDGMKIEDFAARENW